MWCQLEIDATQNEVAARNWQSRVVFGTIFNRQKKKVSHKEVLGGLSHQKRGMVDEGNWVEGRLDWTAIRLSMESVFHLR